MKPKSSNRLLLSFAAIIAVSLPTASAVTLFWDGTDTTADADGGPGTWDTTTLNWDDAATAGNPVSWPTTGTDNIATFGGAVGAVVIDPAGITANGLVVNTAAYTVSGGPLTLNGTTPTATSAVAATINSNLVGAAGLTKAGNGTVSLGGDNSLLTGTLTIQTATAGNNGGIALLNNTAIGGLSPVTIESGGFFGLNGVTLGAAVPISVSGGGGITAPPGALRNLSGNSVVNGPVAIANNVVRISNTGGANSSLTLNGPVTAIDPTHGVVVRNNDGQGVIFTNSANSWGGTTDLAQGSPYFYPGTLPATSILFLGSVLNTDLGTNGTFTRALGGAAGEVRIGKPNDGQRITGFSARGGDLTVNLGGAGADIPFFNSFAKIGTRAIGSPTVTDIDIANLVVGMSVTGTGIPADTLVSALSGTSVTLNKNATTAAVAGALSFYAASLNNRYNTSVLQLNGVNADGIVTLQNSIDLNGFTRTIRTDASTAIVASPIRNLSTLPAGVIFTVTGAANILANGVIEDGNGVVSLGKTGSGTVTLAGDNTFTGGITFSSGTANIGNIRLTSGTGLGPAAVAKIIDMSGSTGSAIGAIELTGGITVAGKTLRAGGRTNAAEANAFLRNVSGNNTWSGPIQINNSGGSYSINPVADLLTLSGNLSNTVAGGARVFHIAGDGNTRITGTVTTATGFLKSGTGTLTLTNANSYSGNTTVNAGTVVAQRTTQVALGTGAVTVASGARVSIVDHAGGGQLPYTNTFTLSGSGVSGDGALNFFNSGLFNMSGTIAISGGTTIRTDPQGQTTAGTVTFTNVISGTDGLTLFSEAGVAGGRPGFALTAPSTYTGSTVLSSSGINTNPFVVTLSGGDNRLPATTELIFGGTPTGNLANFNKSVTLALAGISQELAGISTANSPATVDGYRVAGASTTTATLVINNPGAVTFNGVLGGGGTNQNNLAFTKNGAGTFSLAGSHTYTGDTTVAGGNLEVDSAFFADDSAVTVATGATLTLNTGTNDVVSALIIGNTPLADGTYTATSPQTSGILLGTGSIQVIGGTPYDTFTAGIANPADRGANDDPDADGIANGAEFVIGGNPASGSDVGLLPTQTFVTADLGNGSTDYLKFTFRRTDVSAYLAPGAEYDADLTGIWTPATNGVAGVVVQTADDGFALGVDRVDVYIPRSLASSGKLFARLQVVVTP